MSEAFQIVPTMKTLLVLRHAKSSWDDSSVDDHDRPLNERGRHDGPKVGERLREHQLTPDVIISSDAVRARLTADAVADASRYVGDIVLDARLYAASVADILEVLRTVPKSDDGSVMIVGHNPGLEELVMRLTGERQSMPTASVAQIVLPIDRWSELDASTHGTLLALWRPKERPM